ncbi:P-loop containing nucleoside triphosphate hydrolase protein [Lasiosphaeria hispida]|uniref:P-loop containing nucleoside triphosphate hydrolase protein n=1 Tax=Lasiosphaeria hispida TaxID=260671 RepID=A0AAJ0MFC5_9PEZI|nr:P-loop containing nucleoside triphosphate hydrolase protein [Lasiosphaeria hispida]
MAPRKQSKGSPQKYVVPANHDQRRRQFSAKVSGVGQDWQKIKQNYDLSVGTVEAVDQVMALVGLEEVKEQVLAILKYVDVAKNQDVDVQKQRFHIVFQGNPGTGKTTTARIYAKFLYSIGVLKSNAFEEWSGTKLVTEGPKAVQSMLKDMVGDDDDDDDESDDNDFSFGSDSGKGGKGGVLFVDEAYQLTAPHSSGAGSSILDLIETEMENSRGRFVAIFTGYTKDMQSFFEHNMGIRIRVPYTLQFADFEDQELWAILRDKIGAKYEGRMKVQCGMDGLYMRIAIRRLARGRGVRGFGNARAVENLLAQIAARQAKRLSLDKDAGKTPDYFLFTKEDLIGPPPSRAFQSRAWTKLQGMTGLEAVKSSIKSMVGMLQRNYNRELKELALLNLSLNRVFFGSPGTGKTTVARLYGEILADIGLLSDGEVVMKNPAHFIGDVLGRSEQKTRSILAATVGKVLVIDEAYMLYSGKYDGNNDSYKTSVIDTIVAEVQGVPGDDRCILLLGYEDRLRDMFRHVNEGLSRRFKIEDAFRFEDFSRPQLEEIMRLKMKEQDLGATLSAVAVAMGILDRTRAQPNFSNAGEVVNLLDTAKVNFQLRQDSVPRPKHDASVVFEPADFDPNFARRHDRAGSDSGCSSPLEGLVGEDVIKKLEELAKYAQVVKASGGSPWDLVPTRFNFKGPSGTGKTTAARHLGKLFYNMGFFATDEVIECSVQDLVGRYVGETRPKTKEVVEKAIGRVLVIEDAPSLAVGSFGAEAIAELEYRLSMPRYAGRLVIVLTGGDEEMDRLMAHNPSLSALFVEEIVFGSFAPEASLGLLDRQLRESRIGAPFLGDVTHHSYATLRGLLGRLSTFPSWANARSVQALGVKMIRSALATCNHHRLDQLGGGGNGDATQSELSRPTRPFHAWKTWSTCYMEGDV